MSFRSASQNRFYYAPGAGTGSRRDEQYGTYAAAECAQLSTSDTELAHQVTGLNQADADLRDPDDNEDEW